MSLVIFQKNFYVMLVKLLPFERRVLKTLLKLLIISEILLKIFPLKKIRKSLSLRDSIIVSMIYEFFGP